MHPTLNIATRAARSAGQVILRSVNHIDTLNISEKQANDYVTEVDKRAEVEIINVIRRAYPDHAILAEESGASGEGDFQWIIDPLDGTTNFLRGIPQFSVSIAMLHKGKLELGVVYDPVKDEMFMAYRGNGAQLNDRRIRVTARKTMRGALLGTGFPFRPDQDLDRYLKTLKALIPDTAGIRRPGSAALDLAYVAAGRYDAFWELGLNRWDMAAGALIVREAGGAVTDIDGTDSFLDSGDLLASNLRLHEIMLKRLRDA
ncbi:MAG: inositol monophosphatase [Gammaproteobacteria bacterium]|nr:inositol monophosphatase [Gammaproteobacteria bacterium]